MFCPEFMSTVLARPPLGIHTARGQASFADDVFPKNGIENAMSVMSSMIGSKAHGPFFSLEPCLGYCFESLPAPIRRMENVKNDPREAKERTLHVSEVKDHALICRKSPGV